MVVVAVVVVALVIAAAVAFVSHDGAVLVSDGARIDRRMDAKGFGPKVDDEKEPD